MAALLPDHMFGRFIDTLVGLRDASELPGIPGYTFEKSIFYDLKRSFDGGLPGLDEYQAIRREGLLGGAFTVAEALLPFVNQIAGTKSGPQGALEVSPAHPSERWFFLNGICSNLRIAELNRAALAELVGRPIHLLYNATDGFLADIAECAAGKAFNSITEAAAPNFEPLVDALCHRDVDRVVLVSHSQGTIIAAVLLKTLQEVLFPGAVPRVRARKPSPERNVARALLGRELSFLAEFRRERLAGGEQALASFDAAVKKLTAELTDTEQRSHAIGKLELYCFANCATSMAPFVQLPNPIRRAPWIESYGHEYDLVARLGVLAVAHGAGSSRIQGDSYYRREAWGHLLNAHYLAAMYAAFEHEPGATWEPFPENLRTRPRLWDYRGGNTPDGPI